MDPLIAYPVLGASSSLINRLLQTWFPTPLEKGQLNSIYENLDLARSRLESEERRSALEIRVRRELVERQLESEEKRQADHFEMNKWPLETTASSIVRFSKNRQNSPLNVILKYGARRFSTQKSGKASGLALAVEYAACNLIDKVGYYFSNDVLYYKETLTTKGAHILSGQQLVSTISSLTSTEPIALVELSIESPNSVMLSVSCWGWSGDASAPDLGNNSTLFLQVPTEETECVAALETGILSIISVLSDQYQTIRELRTPPEVRSYKIVKECAEVVFESRQPGGSAKVQTNRELAISSHNLTLECVARYSAQVAGEAAAAAALSAADAGEEGLANSLLDQAISNYRSSVAHHSDDHALFQRLLTPPSSDTRPLIYDALRKIRGIDHADFPNETRHMSKDEITSRLAEFDFGLTEEQKRKLLEKVTAMFTYEPKIGIFGKTGVGKSSLCNALFGQEACKIADVAACTREPQSVLLTLSGGKKMTLVDAPGVGESASRDVEYGKLYRNLLPELDAIIWVIKADDRALEIDERFFRDIVRPYVGKGHVFLPVISQVDKVEPFREWDESKRKPGPNQARNIHEKVDIVSALFGVSREEVAVVSSHEKFGLTTLIDKLILMLPNFKKVSVFEHVSDSIKSEKTKEIVRKSIWEETKHIWNEAKDLAGRAADKFVGWIKSWF